jgi:hypothetical protein
MFHRVVIMVAIIIIIISHLLLYSGISTQFVQMFIISIHAKFNISGSVAY